MDVLDARNPGAPRLNITCNGDSALAHRAGENGRVIRLPEETHDTGFAMTSSFSTMLLTALALQVLMPGHQIIQVAHLESDVLYPCAFI